MVDWGLGINTLGKHILEVGGWRYINYVGGSAKGNALIYCAFILNGFPKWEETVGWKGDSVLGIKLNFLYAREFHRLGSANNRTTQYIVYNTCEV